MLDRLRSLLRPTRPKRGEYLFLGGGQGVAVAADGRKLFLPAGEAEIAPSVVFHGVWQGALDALLLRLLRPGMAVAEIGAGYGFHTLGIAARIGPAGVLHAFEPAPQVLRHLRRTLKFNGLPIILHELAALHVEARASFMVPEDRPIGAELEPEGDGAPRRITVAGSRLDLVLGEQRLDLLRIDAGGSAAMALVGAHQALLLNPLLQLVIDWDPPAIARHGDVAECAGWLAALNFAAQRLAPDGTLTRVADLPALDPCTLLLSRPERG